MSDGYSTQHDCNMAGAGIAQSSTTSRALAAYALAANTTGSTMAASSFSDLFTRVEIDHLRISSAGYGLISSRGPAPRRASACSRWAGDHGHAVSSAGSKVTLASMQTTSPDVIAECLLVA
jgi:hypothetical protein